MRHSLDVPGNSDWQMELAGHLYFGIAAAAAPLALASTVPPTTTALASNADSSAAQQVVQRHLETLAVAKKRRTDNALCAAVASAERTQQTLGQDLQRQRDSIFNRSADTSAALQQLEQIASDATAKLPGVGLAVGAETVYHYVRHGALASYAPAGSAAQRALQIVGEIWKDPAGQAVYFEPSTDVSGCMRPSSVVPHFRDIAAAWPSVPNCLKSLLRPKLVAGLEELTGETCYCADESETASAVSEIGKLARILQSPTANSLSIPPATQARRARRYMCR